MASRPAHRAYDVRCCLFCDVAAPLRIMLDRVVDYIAIGDAMADAWHCGQAEACGFCGRSTRTCNTTLNVTKVCTNCPYRDKKALERNCNVPWKCPIPMCPASPLTLNIQCHLQLLHRGLEPEPIDVGDWVVEKQIAWHAQKTKTERGQKVRWITIHVDKPAKEGTGHATSTRDEGGGKYRTQWCRASEPDENWRPERCKSHESDGCDTNNDFF